MKPANLAMRRKYLIMALVSVLSVTISGTVMSIHAPAPTVGIPSYYVCQNGGTFTMVASISSMSGVGSWQLNITYAGGNINETSATFGSVWQNGQTASSINYRRGSGLWGFEFNNGGTYSSTSATTLVSVTFRILHKPTTSTLHIVTSSENSQLGTLVLDPNLNGQSYTSSDGFFSNCVL
jgi:hypothetical protein